MASSCKSKRFGRAFASALGRGRRERRASALELTASARDDLARFERLVGVRQRRDAVEQPHCDMLRIVRDPETMTAAIERRVADALDAFGLPYERIVIDPAYADTAAFCERYGMPLEHSVNTLLVASKKEPRQYAACALTATRRLDVNHAVRRRMGVSRVSFATPEETMAVTGMMIGGVTPLALDESLPLYVDESVMELAWILVGGGSRSSKIKIAPEVFRRMGSARITSICG
jgi:prolyl-tRNA editing enzyme YbaK/EbsC (Cys-tRNA(Pro) deacylase)